MDNIKREKSFAAAQIRAQTVQPVASSLSDFPLMERNEMFSCRL
jgi:hypothetical protein